MKETALSIRTILLAVVSALTLLVAVVAVREVYARWNRLENVEALKGATLISDNLFDATEKFSIERDIGYTLLYAPDADTAAVLAERLKESRASADEALRNTLQSMAKYPFPELEALRKRIDAHISNIYDLRKRIDRESSASFATKDAVLAQQWHDEVTRLIDQTQGLWLEFVRHFTNIDPIVTQHLRYKHFLRIITDYSGQERAVIARLITENADPAPEEAARLMEGRGILAIGWQTADLLASQSGLYPAIQGYFTDAKSHADNLYDMIRSSFFLPGVKREGAWPISAEMWLELSDQTAESFRTLKDESVKETWRYVETLEARQRRSILLHALFLAFAVGLCVYSFFLIINRVVYPINAMVETLLGTIYGDQKRAVPLKGRQLAEIGKLARILEAFQKNVEVVRRALDTVARNESRLRAVVDYAVDGLVTFDQKGFIETFNPACEKIFGYRAEEVIGRNIKILMPESFHSEHDNYLNHYISESGKHIAGTAGREVRGKRKNGSTFPMELSISPFQQEDGQHFSGIIRDITERKQAEDQLLRYTRELERSNQELDDFAYIASHDLKEPLRGLFNHASFLLEDYSAKLDEDGVRRLNRLSHLAQRMEHLVNDLLYFSRLGRSELAVQETNINAIIIDIEQMMESSLREKNAHIVIPQPLPTIVCDKPRITEVFRNLITNAIKYNDKPERIVEIGFLENADTPSGPEKEVFYVKDNGVGIEQGFHQQIFRIFKRLQRATEEKEEGTGVGLTFVKKIIERHKGRIWLESEPGQGTTFYFTIRRQNP